jgi:2-dehydropantoate 2-reductase
MLMGETGGLVWPRIAVVGAGAVGCYFGGMLARAGAPVTLVGRHATVDAITREQLSIQDSVFREGKAVTIQQRVPVAATTCMKAAGAADVVLLCVKTIDTESVATELAQHLAPRSVVLSMQNGVDNARRIFAASRISALPSVVYVSVAMSGQAQVTKSGDAKIILGTPKDSVAQAQYQTDAVTQLAKMFAAASIDCQISNNIDGELWLKLLWNCAGNAVTALGRATYGQVSASALARQTMLAAALEVRQVAQAAGVVLPHVQLTDELIRDAHDAGDITSSTAQDVLRGKKTEIDSLNGYVVKLAKELGVPTPVNQTLYSLVKLLEVGHYVSSTVVTQSRQEN